MTSALATVLPPEPLPDLLPEQRNQLLVFNPANRQALIMDVQNIQAFAGGAKAIVTLGMDDGELQNDDLQKVQGLLIWVDRELAKLCTALTELNPVNSGDD